MKIEPSWAFFAGRILDRKQRIARLPTASEQPARVGGITAPVVVEDEATPAADDEALTPEQQAAYAAIWRAEQERWRGGIM